MKKVFSVLITTIMLFLSINFSASPAEAHAPGIVLYGVGTPVAIDGIMSPGEWDHAREINFSVKVPEGGTTPGTVYVMNDSTNLYLAVRYVRDHVDQQGSLSFGFDYKDNGQIDGFEDAIVYNIESGFADDVRLLDHTAPSDVMVGGTNDGCGNFTNDGTYSIYEMSHPLDSSDDDHDFSLLPGDVIGFGLTIHIGNSVILTHTVFPSGSLGDIKILPSDTACGKITVQAVSPPFTSPSVPIDWSWSLQDGSLSDSDQNMTTFSIDSFGDVTLQAPPFYIEGTNYYVFTRWFVGTFPEPPDINTESTTVTFTPDGNKLATAMYRILGKVTPEGVEHIEVGVDTTISCNIGFPQAGVPVNFASDNIPFFTSSGDLQLGKATTDDNGEAQLTYHNDYPRNDVVYAYLDWNVNGVWDINEPRSASLDTTKIWLGNAVTGSGKINDENGNVIWSLSGVVRIEGNQLKGNFQIIDHIGSRPGYTGETPVIYECEQFTSMNVPPGGIIAESPVATKNTVILGGTFTNNRNDENVDLMIIILDRGDPGAEIDMIAVQTSTPGPEPEYIAWIGTIPQTQPPPIYPEPISSGNFQVHDIVNYHLPSPNEFQKGITFADWRSFDGYSPGMYLSPQTDLSLQNLTTTGANWISLVVCGGQETRTSTDVFYTQPRTATDAELFRIVKIAHSLGIRVLLKPQLDFSDDPTHWRGQIGMANVPGEPQWTEAEWEAWFSSYGEFINHYANFSQEAGVDMLSIGTELGGTTHQEADWRWIIEEVRNRYKGKITYSSLCSPNLSIPPEGLFPHGEEARITWWDAVDYIGIDAYYELTNKDDPTVAELKTAWTDRGYIELLKNLSGQFNKQIIFTEFGYMSRNGNNKYPGWYTMPGEIDLQEQADCYQAALEVLWGQPWLSGLYWWQWIANTFNGGPYDDNYTPYGKPAEQVLKDYYLLP